MGQCITMPPTPPPESQPVCPISHVYIEVLYVDGSDSRRQTIRNSLRYHTISVACCGSGGQAIQWLSQQKPHAVALVILHQSLPDMNVAALAGRIHELRPKTPVYGILQAPNENLVASCIRAHMDTLFTASNVPGPILPSIIEFVELQREPCEANLAHLSFYPGTIIT